MADDKKKEEKRLTYQLGDDTIAVIRELVQFSILTGTNIVDHLRAVHLEYNEEFGKLFPTDEYIESYNQMIKDLSKKVEEGKKEMEKRFKAAMEEEESN